MSFPTLGSVLDLDALIATMGEEPGVAAAPPPPADALPLALALVEIWGTDSGRRVIDHLLTLTLRRPDMPVLGLPADQVALHAAYRAGLADVGKVILALFQTARDAPDASNT